MVLLLHLKEHADIKRFSKMVISNIFITIFKTISYYFLLISCSTVTLLSKTWITSSVEATAQQVETKFRLATLLHLEELSLQWFDRIKQTSVTAVQTTVLYKLKYWSTGHKEVLNYLSKKFKILQHSVQIYHLYMKRMRRRAEDRKYHGAGAQTCLTKGFGQIWSFIFKAANLHT